MKTSRILPVILLAALLVACGEKRTADSQQAAAADPAASLAAEPALPESAPAVGAAIQDAVKPKADEKSKQDGEYAEIAWEDLELPGHGLEDIVKKYQPQIDSIPEGDPAEKSVMEKMQKELDSAPVNPAMNGKKVKIPGYVSPLEVDDKKGMVKEFLLVPYFGACIHIPPPPLNQTLLVKPAEGKSIGMERIYEPVWVYGALNTEGAVTSLANAGYRIDDARVEMYEAKDDEVQDGQ